LWTKLSDALTEEQKSKKVAKLIANLRRSERIHNAGTRKSPVWILAEKNAE
jgi:ATP-dependent DNA helicase RecG